MDNLVRYDFRREGIIKAVGLDTDKSPIMDKTRGRVLQYHALMYIIKGAGHFEDSSTMRRRVTPGALFHLHPRRWHNFDPEPGTVWTEYWVLFDGAKARKSFGNIIPAAEKSFYQAGLDQEFTALYEELYDIWFYQGKGFREYSSLLLHEILAKAWLRVNGFTFRRKHDWLHRVRTHMKNNLSAPECDLRKFAAAENIGHEAFRKRFKKMTGFSPKQYFLLLKLNRAKEMLLRQDESIKSVACGLGFDDPYYFSRLFRKKEGISPKGYRRWLAIKTT
jgi:AraC-like DNA-binding protein